MPTMAVSLALALGATVSPVRLLEVAYDVVGTEPDGEWIEVGNTADVVASLDDVRVGDEEELGGSEAVLAFPAGAALGPGEVAVIATDAAAFEAAHGFLPTFAVRSNALNVPVLIPDRALGGTQFQLANTADEVLLRDANGVIFDGVSWGRSPALAGVPNAPLATAPRTLGRAFDEATGALSSWSVTDASPGTLPRIPEPRQQATDDDGVDVQEPPPPEPPTEQPAPEEPAPDEPAAEEPEPEPEPEPAPAEEPSPSPAPSGDDETDHDGGSDAEDQPDNRPARDDGRGVELEREPTFDGPRLPEANGCAAAPPSLWGALALLAVGAVRRRQRPSPP